MTDGRHGVHQPRVGVVGGGQLARMLTHAGERLDLEVRILAKPSDTSMRGHDPLVTVGDPDEPGVLDAFAATVDVVTFENELVDLDVLRALEARGVAVRPGSHVLAMSNKATQRRALAALSLPLPPFVVTTEASGVEKFAAEHGWPLVVKSATGGYDGRGVHMVDDAGGLATLGFDGSEFVVEPMLDIELELAVLVARRPGGDTVTFPVVETVQRRGMCREVHAPAGVSSETERAARHLGESIAASVDAVGVLAVELFVVDGEVLVNELAPRVHNSGHLTIEANDTSQFEQHLRAVADLPLGSTSLRVPAATMVNVVGDTTDVDPRDRLAEGMAAGDAAIHLYGKAPRPERKIGHVTSCGPDRATAHRDAASVAAALMNEPV
jgi:5-(carboxyamino)imidazole ribonucleotide synthase